MKHSKQSITVSDKEILKYVRIGLQLDKSGHILRSHLPKPPTKQNMVSFLNFEKRYIELLAMEMAR